MEQLYTIEDDEATYPLARPIYPIERIQTYFGDQDFQQKYGFPHMGIQIEAEQRTPIYATRNGVVYFIADSDAIAINWMIIVHTDGYVTTYQYINESIVKPGDIVRR